MSKGTSVLVLLHCLFLSLSVCLSLCLGFSLCLSLYLFFSHRDNMILSLSLSEREAPIVVEEINRTGKFPAKSFYPSHRRLGVLLLLLLSGQRTNILMYCQDSHNAQDSEVRKRADILRYFLSVGERSIDGTKQLHADNNNLHDIGTLPGVCPNGTTLEVCVTMERHWKYSSSHCFHKIINCGFFTRSFVHSFAKWVYQTVPSSLFRQPSQNQPSFGRLSIMNLSKLSFISILAVTVVAANTTGGLRHQPVLTADTTGLVDDNDDTMGQPNLTPGEEFVIALSDAEQGCKPAGEPCGWDIHCCSGYFFRESYCM